jgi:hypothetical protein
MSATNALIATNLLLSLLDRSAQLGTLLQQAQKEGRDLTAAELDLVFASDAVARAKLESEILAAKASRG